MGLRIRYALGKSYYVSKIPPEHTKIQLITVSVFLCSVQLTALLLKSFRLLLHCYTLANLRSMSNQFAYGVATVSRIEKIIGLFCKRDL